MRTVTYGAACSLDGFIAARDGAIDWLHFTKDVQQQIASYWKTIDTMLIGRKTWAVGEEQGGAGAMTQGITTYLFSRTMREAPPGVQLVSGGAGAFVRELKQQPGKGICLMGGGELAVSLLEAGVVDEVRLNVHPILLGDGIPLFRDAGRRIPLELLDSRVIEGGCVISRYRVRA
jgi:dihydrofolate reductase